MPPRKISHNIEMLGVVAQGLKGLKEKVVFVGGATIDLFISDSGAPATRATDDVDCVVELTKRTEYHGLEMKLRALGFKHPLGERAPICRWSFCGIKVDVMPTEGAILGFNNRWYKEGVAVAEETTLYNGERIHVFSVPYLLASKLDAFHDRGRRDFLASPDMEDIIALLDGCPEVEEKTHAVPINVRRYLSEEFGKLLGEELFMLSLDGQLNPHREGKQRLERCAARMRRISEAG